jgi:tetratricopeptide (TPR) repeat protein
LPWRGRRRRAVHDPEYSPPRSTRLELCCGDMRLSLLVAAIGLLLAPGAKAQSGPSPAPVSLAPSSLAPAAPVSPAPAGPRVLTDGRAAPAQAAEHFERALAWYRAGKYQLAVEELKAALERDPGGKDLVFNLALVQEKLGDLTGAIDSLQRFQAMEKDPKELERATQAVDRLRGAQAELLAAAPSAPTVTSSPLTNCPPVRERGKLDGWVIGTGSFALASLLVGTVFGVRALTLDAEKDASSARDAAIVADVALATGLLVGAGSVALYWGRFADPPLQSAMLPTRRPSLDAGLAHLQVRF